MIESTQELKITLDEAYLGQVRYDKEYQDVNSLDVPSEMHYTFTYGQIFKYLITLDKPVIPQALVRGTNLYENKLPYVFTNPNPEAPILPGDKIMIYGEIDQLNWPGDISQEDDSKKKKNAKKYDISDYIKEIIKEDELFEIEDDVLQEKQKDEQNDTREDRNTLMQQNVELKRLQKEFDALKVKQREETGDMSPGKSPTKIPSDTNAINM